MEHYKLPNLSYPLDALAPITSEEQLSLHYNKHHATYVKKANQLTDKILEGTQDLKTISQKLSFNLGGHVLHSLFWTNLKPADQDEGSDFSENSPLKKQFESKDNLIQQIIEVGKNIEGSGWVGLSFDTLSMKCLLTAIGNHNLYLIPESTLVLVIDCWEHAYYLDYKNDRESYLKNICTIINWAEVENRLLAQE